MSTILTHQITGETRIAPTGFSFTTLFFGFFPALFRGDLFWAAIMFVTAMVTYGLAWLVWPFVYNGLHIQRLLKRGFRYGQAPAYASGVQQHVHVNIGSLPPGEGNFVTASDGSRI